MSSCVRTHIRQHVVGYIALFVALSGTAAALPGSNTVTSGDIRPNAVKTGDIKDGAVTGAKVDEASLDSAVLQSRVTGSCPGVSAVSAVNTNGTVDCEPNDSLGLLLGGVDQSLANNDYISPTSGTASSVFIRNSIVIPVDLKLSNLRAFSSDALVPVSLTVWRSPPTPPVAPVSTGYSCTIDPLTASCVSSGTLNLSAGDVISYRVTSPGGALANGLAFGATLSAP
jgi:hypothetical protein